MPGWLKVVLGGAAIVGSFIALMLIKRCRENQIRSPFDADKHLSSGMKEALEHGAELASIEAHYVTPDARVHTEYGGTLRVSWEARESTPGETAVMPGAPRAAGGERCTEYSLHVRVEQDMDGVFFDDRMSVSHGDACYQKTAPGPLFCTIQAIWDRAIAAGAPNPALATIKLETTGEKKRRWTFRIVDDVDNGPKKTLFEAEYADDCSPRVER